MTSSTTPKTVLLKGDPLMFEGNANGATIKPGHLVKGVPDGDVDPHDEQGGECPALFAKEAEYVGGDIDTAYADNERVPVMHCKPGDEVYAWLAAGNDAALGARLVSAGDGTLELDLSSLTGHAIAQAVEAVDNDPGSGGAAVRIKVRII